MSATTKTIVGAVTVVDQENEIKRGLARVSDAERYLNLSRATIYNLMSGGTLKYVLIGRSRRIPWEALEELVQRNTIGAA